MKNDIIQIKPSFDISFKAYNKDAIIIFASPCKLIQIRVYIAGFSTFYLTSKNVVLTCTISNVLYLEANDFSKHN